MAAKIIGHRVDEVFRKMGIDPLQASLAAFAEESFPVQEFGKQMLLRRVKDNVHRDALSLKLGRDISTIRKWETGERVPNLVAATDWAESLGLEVTVLVTPKKMLAPLPRPKTLSPKPKKPRKTKGCRGYAAPESMKTAAGLWLARVLRPSSDSSA